MYFKGMRINENGEEINISDHNLIRAWFKIGRVNGADWKKTETELRKWYTLDQEALENMEKEVENRIRGPISFRGMMGILIISQEKHLKRTRKILIGKKRREEVLSAPWIDRKGIMMIKLRKIKSRAWRHARNKNPLQREQRVLKRK